MEGKVIMVDELIEGEFIEDDYVDQDFGSVPHVIDNGEAVPVMVDI